MRTVLALMILGLMTFARPALAQVKMPGYPCVQLGATTMADNQQNLVACLKDANANLVWKTMSTNGGQIFTKCQNKFSSTKTYPLCPAGWSAITQYAMAKTYLYDDGVARAAAGIIGDVTANDDDWFYFNYTVHNVEHHGTLACTVCERN